MIEATAQDDRVEARGDREVPWWNYTKTVVAAASLVLVAQGRFRLDARLPDQAFSLRQLLQHRAGLADYGALAAYHVAVAAGEAPWPELDMLARLPRAGPPGRFGYSNVGYTLVRRLIEAETGLSLGAALDTLVLRPLGVPGPFVAAVAADLDDTAWGNAQGYHPGWVYHGLLVGTAGSAALLLHRLLSGALLPGPLLADMLHAEPVEGDAGTQDRPWGAAGYGLGVMRGEGSPPGIYVGHTGGGPGSTSAVYRREGGGCTAAVFARLDAPGQAERRDMALAAQG